MMFDGIALIRINLLTLEMAVMMSTAVAMMSQGSLNSLD
jgi:hypothetical protein